MSIFWFLFLYAIGMYVGFVVYTTRNATVYRDGYIERFDPKEDSDVLNPFDFILVDISHLRPIHVNCQTHQVSKIDCCTQQNTWEFIRWYRESGNHD